METEKKQEKTELQLRIEQATLSQVLAEGKLVRLRGVQEQDLGRIAELRAEAPLDAENVPWTTQRLRKMFESKEDTGLWSKKNRVFVAYTKAGETVGFIHEKERDFQYGIHFHVGNEVADRDEIGTDLIRTYKQMHLDWHDPGRIEVSLLDVEASKQRWLSDNGFELEVAFREMYMYRGEAVALQIWGWLGPRVAGRENNDGEGEKTN